MSADFDWRFRDEEARTKLDKPSPRRKRLRPWLVLLAVLALVGVGVFVWWKASRESLRQQDRQVQAVAELELRAIAAGDEELYLSLQDTSDAAWYRAQEILFAKGVFALPPAPGLNVAEVTVKQARAIGDLARVELTVVAAPVGAEDASFSATRFYRRLPDGRWMHSQLDPEYLGGVRVWLGEYVRLVGYEADAEWLGPVAPQLERTGRSLCVMLECQGELPMTLAFTDTVGSLAGLGGAWPAPLLAGRPTDETSESVWYAALGDHLLDRFIARETGVSEDALSGKPPSIALIARRVRERIRAHTGLRRPIVLDTQPVGDALESGCWMTLAEIEDLAEAVSEEEWLLLESEIDLFLDFVAANYGERGVVDLMRAMPESESMSGLSMRAFGTDLETLEELYFAYTKIVTGRSLETETE